MLMEIGDTYHITHDVCSHENKHRKVFGAVYEYYKKLRCKTMNFHSTTAPRILEIDSTRTVEHRITLHYSDSRDFTRDATAVVVDKNVEAIK